MRRIESTRNRIAPFASLGFAALAGGLALAGDLNFSHVPVVPSLLFSGTTAVFSYVYGLGIFQTTGHIALDYMRQGRIPRPSLSRNIRVNIINNGIAAIIAGAGGYQIHSGLDALHAPDWAEFASPFIFGALTLYSSVRVNYIHDEVERGAHN